MKPKNRHIQSIVATAGTSAVEMPWSRGARRATFMARRATTRADYPKKAC